MSIKSRDEIIFDQISTGINCWTSTKQKNQYCLTFSRRNMKFQFANPVKRYFVFTSSKEIVCISYYVSVGNLSNVFHGLDDTL